MGGRGAKSGVRKTVNVTVASATPAAANTGGVAGLAAAFSATGPQATNTSGYRTYGTMNGDYDGGGNQQLQKWQSQDDDKAASYLAKLGKTADVNDPKYADGYVYHDNPMQKMIQDMGLNNPPVLLSNKDFNAYVKQANAEVMYRGVSGQSAKDRTMFAKGNHIGNGVIGDGLYFTPDIQTARNFAGPSGKIMKMALSPNARVIQHSDLVARMANASPKLKAAMYKAGHNAGSGPRTFGNNSGEMQYALKLGYNVIQSGTYLVSATRDAFVINKDY